MLIETRAREVTSAAEVFANARETRARLMGPVPPAEPAPTRLPPQNAKRPIPKTVPLPSIDEIVAAVAAAAGVEPSVLLSEVEVDQIVESRKIAFAAIAFRLGLDEKAVADHFGVLPAAVRHATSRATRILENFAVPRSAPVSSIVAALFNNWVVRSGLSSHVLIDEIKRAVCAEFGVSKAELESDRRYEPVLSARKIALALTKRLTARSLPFIGLRFNRDHSTVLHACHRMQPFVDRVALRLSEKATIEEWVVALHGELTGKAPA